MTCEDFRSRLTAFSLGELDPSEAEAAREHVGHCSACASATLLDRQLTALLLVPAPARSGPLAAAWTAYRSEATIRWAAPTGEVAGRLNAVLGPAARTPDLSAFGLRPRGWGARDLAGHLAAVAEYRSDSGRRVALIRWRGQLPRTIGAAAETGPGGETGPRGGAGRAPGGVWH